LVGFLLEREQGDTRWVESIPAQSHKPNRQETHIAAMLGHHAELVATLQVHLDDSFIVQPASISNIPVIILDRTNRPILLPKSA
jgi:hypothetical protein